MLPTYTFTVFLLLPFLFAPIAPPIIPNTAVAENTYNVPTGYLCAWSNGQEFYTLSDDVYGTYGGPGFYNKYIVTIDTSAYFNDEYFRVYVFMVGYQPGDKIIIQILEIPGATTVSYYCYAQTPTYKITSGTYTVLVGYLKVANVPAHYRISMG